MQVQSRKSFFKTLGLLGAGGLLNSQLNANSVNRALTLVPAEQKRKRLLRVAHLTDIHVKPEKIAEQGMAAAFTQANLMADKPDFIINGGDAIMNAVSFSKENVKQQWHSFQSVLKDNNSLPLYHCIGNHDLYGWALPGVNCEEGKKWAMNEYSLTSPYYSFTQNGWHFIVLDSIHARKSIPGYYGKLDDEQFAWLENELQAVPEGTHVCVVSHIPILAVCTLFDSTGGSLTHNNWLVPDNCLHSDAAKLRDLFYSSKKVKACLSGHIHLIDHVNYLGTDYYCNGAVSGGWWKGNHQQFAPSFIVMNFYDDGTTEREIHFYDWQV